MQNSVFYAAIVVATAGFWARERGVHLNAWRVAMKAAGRSAARVSVLEHLCL